MNKLISLPNDPLFPALADAVDSDTMTAILRDELSGASERNGHELIECIPEYFRYKPGVSCIIGYRLEISDIGGFTGKTQRVYGRFVDPQQGRASFEKALKTHKAIPNYGPPITYIKKLGMMLSFFPNDRCLRGLRFALYPDKLKRIAQHNLRDFLGEHWRIRGRRSQIEILSYKPERHCVVKCQLGLRNIDTGEKKQMKVIAKLLRPEKAHKLYDANEQIWELFRSAGRTQIIPRPLAFDPSFSLFFQEDVGGSHPSYQECSAGIPQELICQIAGRLRSLHDVVLNGIRRYPPEQELRDLEESILETAKVLPDEGEGLLEQLHHVCEEFHILRPRTLQTVHGDFHLEQVMITNSGPVILDLDEIRASDPLSDVANFTAHLLKLQMEGICSREEVEKAEQVFIESYFRKREIQSLKSAYLWHKKVSLIRLALSNLKFLRPDWRGKMNSFLNEVKRLSIR
ncbi:MAG: phosphotransferase family protein [Candidatus Glassbacteria bacterium]